MALKCNTKKIKLQIETVVVLEVRGYKDPGGRAIQEEVIQEGNVNWTEK